MPEFDSVKVKDQLGRPEDVGVVIKRFTETAILESNTVAVNHKSIGASFILGHQANGVLGVTSGVTGKQVTLGESARVLTLWAIASPNKIHREHYRDNYFKNASTTGDWAVTSGELGLSAGEIAVSSSVAYNDGTVSKVTLSVTPSSGSASNLMLQVSANGGSIWMDVVNNRETIVTATGVDLRYKIAASASVIIAETLLTYG